MIEHDIFLIQEDVLLLTRALNKFALDVNAADDRQGILINASIDLVFRSKLTFEASPQLFTNKLIARFREYRVSTHQPTYHPMVSLLDYLLEVYELEDQDRNLFKRLVAQGHNNFRRLAACSAVGRIESPLGTGIATGVLVDRQLLLTCYHVFKRIFEDEQEQAWVRFGYKTGRYGIETGEAFELDIKNIASTVQSVDQGPDYALVRIFGKPEFRPAFLSKSIPCPTQCIRMIHHPRGEPVQISDAGQIIQVDRGSIKHNIEASYGSSGSPIFDLDWHVVALHQGIPTLNHASPPGVAEGIPISSIWNDIKPHLHLSVSRSDLPSHDGYGVE